MAGVTGSLEVRAQLSLAGAVHGDGAPTHNVIFDFLQNFAPGTAAFGQADLLYNENFNIAASGTLDLDLVGTLKDALGGNFNAAEILVLAIKTNAANVNNVIVGNAATNQFVGWFGAATHTLKVEPGNCHLLTSLQGATVVAATGDILRLTNSGAGTAVLGEVLIIGRSVAA